MFLDDGGLVGPGGAAEGAVVVSSVVLIAGELAVLAE